MAELRVVSVGMGSSMKPALEKVVSAIQKTGIQYEVGPWARPWKRRRVTASWGRAARPRGSGERRAAAPYGSVIGQRLDTDETVETLHAVKA